MFRVYFDMLIKYTYNAYTIVLLFILQYIPEFIPKRSISDQNIKVLNTIYKIFQMSYTSVYLLSITMLK